MIFATMRGGKHVWGRVNERRSDSASQGFLSNMLHEASLSLTRVTGKRWWEKNEISGSEGGVFGGSPFQCHRAYHICKSKRHRRTEHLRRKVPEEEQFRHGGNQTSASEGRLAASTSGCDRGFTLGKREFTCPHFFCARWCGLRSAGPAR